MYSNRFEHGDRIQGLQVRVEPLDTAEHPGSGAMSGATNPVGRLR